MAATVTAFFAAAVYAETDVVSPIVAGARAAAVVAGVVAIAVTAVVAVQ